MRTTHGLLVVLSALAAAACTSPAKQEAKSLVFAVDHYRQAENAEKPELADAVEAVPCTDAEVCATKEACLAVARPTAKALRLQREVQKGVAEMQDGSLSPYDPKAKAFPEKIEQSEKLLAEGQAALEACDTKLTALRVKYR
jgi:hypothetical protein